MVRASGHAMLKGRRLAKRRYLVTASKIELNW
jgi:hypothetical protein